MKKYQQIAETLAKTSTAESQRAKPGRMSELSAYAPTKIIDLNPKLGRTLTAQRPKSVNFNSQRTTAGPTSVSAASMSKPGKFRIQHKQIDEPASLPPQRTASAQLKSSATVRFKNSESFEDYTEPTVRHLNTTFMIPTTS